MREVEYPGTRFVVHSSPIDLSSWWDGLCLTDEVTEAIGKFLTKEVTEIIASAFRENPPHAWLPLEWVQGDGINDTRVENPGTIYFSVPLGRTDGNDPVYATTLDYLVDDFIEFNLEGDAIHSPDSVDACERLAAHLRALAARLESVCEKEQP